MKQLLPFQYTCVEMPEWLLKQFENIENNAKEINIKEFLTNTELNDWEILRDMIVYDYWNNYVFFKSNYKGYPIYYYVWSAIEHFYFDEDLTTILEEDYLS